MDSSDSMTAMIPIGDPAPASSQLDVVLNCQLFTQVITEAVILCKYSRYRCRGSSQTLRLQLFLMPRCLA